MPSPRKLVVFVGAAALLGAAGCGSATVQGQRARQTPAPQGAGAPPGADLAVLAQKLGVSRARLRTAFASVRSAGGPATSPPAGGPAAALARALGLRTAKVQAALDAVMPGGGPPRANGPRAPPAAGASPA